MDGIVLVDPVLDGSEAANASDAADATEEEDAPDATPDAECKNGCVSSGAPDQICCDGACVTWDVSHCYACGTRCIGSTPACSDVLKRCVCAPDSCGVGLYCDGKSGSCGAANYYVDASVAAGGDGTQARPFKTITAALHRVSADHVALPEAERVILVAAGRYDASLGETFPLLIRGATSLIGAGAGKTMIFGSAQIDHTPAGGSHTGPFNVTIQTGDNAAIVRISRLAIGATAPPSSQYSFGVFCDRGGTVQSATSEVGLTILEDIEIGGTFTAGVQLTGSTNPITTGCHLRMLRSKVAGSLYGLAATGCFADGPRTPLSLELGDDSPTSGNLLSAVGLYNTGVLLTSCVRRAVLQYNTFSDSSAGVTIDQILDPDRKSANSFLFRHNVFRDLSNIGLYVRSAKVDELSDCTFSGISSALALDDTREGAALLLSDEAGELPMLAKARRNQFIGNDIALKILRPSMTSDQTVPIDFGTAADPGNNVFRCNSAWTGQKGADVLLDFSAPATLAFAGNAWDHSPPEVNVGLSPRNGMDIVQSHAAGPTLDTSNATVSAIACPAGQVP